MEDSAIDELPTRPNHYQLSHGVSGDKDRHLDGFPVPLYLVLMLFTSLLLSNVWSIHCIHSHLQRVVQRRFWKSYDLTQPDIGP